MRRTALRAQWPPNLRTKYPSGRFLHACQAFLFPAIFSPFSFCLAAPFTEAWIRNEENRDNAYALHSQPRGCLLEMRCCSRQAPRSSVLQTRHHPPTGTTFVFSLFFLFPEPERRDIASLLAIASSLLNTECDDTRLPFVLHVRTVFPPPYKSPKMRAGQANTCNSPQRSAVASRPWR